MHRENVRNLLFRSLQPRLNLKFKIHHHLNDGDDELFGDKVTNLFATIDLPFKSLTLC